MTQAHKRIAVAFIFGMVLVAGAFVAGKKVSPSQSASAIEANVPKRQFIAVDDTDKNGIPNWQESLLPNDPLNIDATKNATYTAPTTVTGKVAVDLFKNFASAKKYGVFGDSNKEIVEKATKQLVTESQNALFVKEDIHTLTEFDTTTLRLYGDEVATALVTPKVSEKSEIEIFQHALQYNKAEELSQLDPIITTYGTMITQLAKISVPESYAQQHLVLLNTLNAVRDDVQAMKQVDQDALYTFTRVKRYQDDVTQLHQAIVSLFDTLYTKDGVRWQEGEATLKLMQF